MFPRRSHAGSPDPISRPLMTLVVTTMLAGAVFALRGTSGVAGTQPDGSQLIPTGQRLTPAGVHIEVKTVLSG